MEITHILIHYGEITLKGRNRGDFVDQLCDNIRLRLRSTGLKVQVQPDHSNILVDVSKLSSTEITIAAKALSQVFGIANFALVQRVALDINVIKQRVIDMAYKCFRHKATFAVSVQRQNKQFVMTSQAVEGILGDAIQKNTDWKKVNLANPDQTFFVILGLVSAFIYTEKIQGAQGIPVGSSGRVVALLSGGIDSPVAAYYLAKRGCQVDFVHFTVGRLQFAQAEKYKVAKLAAKLSEYTLHSRLYLVPYAQFQIAMMEKHAAFELIMFRRFMSRVAECLAQSTKSQAIVTGDNLAQVASQTLSNLVSTSAAVSLPIFRPLIGFDKNEIILAARKIGTYEISLEPYQDCCALISSKPKTSSKPSVLKQMEKEFFSDYEALITSTLNDTIALEYRCGELVKK